MRVREKAGDSLFQLTGRRVLITGASRGIGRELARGCASYGADVALLGRDERALRETQAIVQAANPQGSVDLCLCDLRDVKSAQSSIAELDDARGFDGLINNAGMNLRIPAADVRLEDWQTVVETDLTGAFFVAQEVGRRMLRRGRGSIVNISSVGGHVALRTGVAYAAAKAGVIQMTKVLALEWSGQGVRVNGIGPWYFRTPLTEKLLADEEYHAQIVARTPMRRVGDVEELVGPTVFLLSDAASYVTGQTLYVDGGMTIYGF